MQLIITASIMIGATSAVAIYQPLLTGNWAWSWLLVLNILWCALCSFGISLVVK